MPDERKSRKADATVDVVEAVSARAGALKKAGLPTAVILFVTVLSIPGVWEFFFDRTDEEAKVKAEVSYQLMKEHMEVLMKQVEQHGDEIDKLRDTINAMLLQRSARALTNGRWETDERVPEPRTMPMLAPLPANLDRAAAAAMEDQ